MIAYMNKLDLKPLIHNIIALEEHELDFDHLRQLKNEFSQENKLSWVPSNSDLFKVYFSMLNDGEIPVSAAFEKLLKKRAVRSQSGIVPVQVLTKPFRCPGKCIFCPNDFTMPKSYINTEPGAQRALLNWFDPIKQTYNRLLSLRLNWHDTDKIEMIVLWGTRDVYPKQYKIDFIKGLYDACNTFDQFWQMTQDGEIEANTRALEIDTLPFVFPQTIAESITINETAGNRMIGLTIETRPEYVTHENCRLRREMGITRIEMGIQSMFDDVLDTNKRGHSIEQVRLAMHILRSYAFKISCHFMPWLYGSTVELDIETFRLAFDDIWVRPDEIKFYPTSVIPNTELYDLYKSWEYIPLETSQIKDITKIVQINHIPPYTRIKRLIRDIPATEIVAWSHVTNLRQLVDKEMEVEFDWDQWDKRSKLYSRLYENMVMCDSVEDFIGKL